MDLGSSYLLSDVLAAFLYAQLENWPAIQNQREHLWNRYHRALAAWALRHQVRRPVVPAHCEQSHHMSYLLFPSLRARQALIARLRALDVYSGFHYLPLHISAMGDTLGAARGDSPVPED